MMKLDSEIASIRNYLQNLKISTDNIMQQQQKCIQHEIATLKQQNWGAQAFRTNQHQNQNLQNFTHFSPITQY